MGFGEHTQGNDAMDVGSVGNLEKSWHAPTPVLTGPIRRLGETIRIATSWKRREALKGTVKGKGRKGFRGGYQGECYA